MSGLINLLLNTEDLTAPYWGKSGCVASTSTLLTSTTNGNAYIERAGLPTPGTGSATFRAKIRADTVGQFHIGLWDGSSWGANSVAGILSGPGNITNVDGSLCRISGLSATEDTVFWITRTGFGGASVFLDGYIRAPGAALIGDSVRLTQLHYQFGASAPLYQRVGASALDYDDFSAVPPPDIHTYVNRALNPLIPNCWANELPPEPTFPAAVFNIDTSPEPGWSSGGGYDQHEVAVVVFARTIEELPALMATLRTGFEGMEHYFFEEDSGDADYEPDPSVYGRYITFRLRTRRT